MATLACAGAHAQPAAQPQKPAPVAAGQPPKPGDVPDSEFIEFLGSDDVGDAAWWEFLKRQPPRGNSPPAPPPQDANR